MSSELLFCSILKSSLTLLGITSFNSKLSRFRLSVHLLKFSFRRARGSVWILLLNSSQIFWILEQKYSFSKSAISFGSVTKPFSVENLVNERETAQPAKFFTLFHNFLPDKSSSATSYSILLLLTSSFLSMLFTLFFTCLQFSLSSCELESLAFFPFLGEREVFVGDMCEA